MTGPVDWAGEFAKRLDSLRGMCVNRLCSDRASNDGDDAVAEAIALSWQRWLRAITKGRDPRRFSTIIGKQSIADVRAGYCLTGGSRLTDALSPAARCHRGYHVASLEDVSKGSNGPFGKAFLTGPGEDPGNAARAHLDWLEWSGALCPQLYSVLVELIAGDSVLAIAHRRGWSHAYAYRLRKRLARSWRAYGVDCQ